MSKIQKTEPKTTLSDIHEPMSNMIIHLDIESLGNWRSTSKSTKEMSEKVWTEHWTERWNRKFNKEHILNKLNAQNITNEYILAQIRLLIRYHDVDDYCYRASCGRTKISSIN